MIQFPSPHSVSRKLSAISCAALLVSAASSNATLLVYEGFSYGLSNGVTMNGVAANATGLTGNYSVLNSVASGGSASSTYSTTGLSFGSNFYTTEGGALRSNSVSVNTTSSFTIAGAQLNTGTVTGTIWSSYLVNFTTLGTSTNSGANLRLNTTATGDSSNSYFISAIDDSTALTKPGVGYNGDTTVYAGSSNLTASTTYLALTQYTNVGTALSAGTSGKATMFVFTLEQYDAWYADGGVESSLGAFAGFTMTETVTSGNFPFGDNRYSQFVTVSGSVNATTRTENAVFDELRYGTTLADVVAVPEPSALGLMVVGGLITIVCRRGIRRSVRQPIGD